MDVFSESSELVGVTNNLGRINYQRWDESVACGVDFCWKFGPLTDRTFGMACTKGRESAASQLFANCFTVAFLGSSSGRLRRRDSRQQIPCLAALTRSTWALQKLGSVKFHRDFPNFWGFWLIQLILPSRMGLKFTLCNQWIWWSVQKMFAKLVAILIGFKNGKIICRLWNFPQNFSQSWMGVLMQ